MEIIILIILIVFLVKLNGRISKIEKKIGLKGVLSSEQNFAQNVDVNDKSQEIPKAPEFAQAMPTQKATIGMTEQEKSNDNLLMNNFGTWIKEDWMMKLGALFLLLGLGWFVAYAFANNWIGPMGRIMLGFITSASIMMFGWYRIIKYVNQGSIFLILGSASIFLTVLAAHGIYDFFTSISVLAIVFLASAATALTSIKYRVPSLALSGLILAGLAPALIDKGFDNFLLFSYLLAVVIGVIWIASVTSQRSLTTASLILFALYSAPVLLGSSLVANELIFFAYIFTIVFFVANIFGILKSKGHDAVYDLLTAVGSATLLLWWIITAVPEHLQSLTVVVWVLIFATGSFVVSKVSVKKEPFYVYTAVSVLLLAAATAMELNGAALTIAYTIESMAIAIIAYVLSRDVRMATLGAILFIAPVALSVQNIFSRAWNNSVLHEDFFVLLILSLTSLTTGLFFLYKSNKLGNEEQSNISAMLVVVGSIYACILIWLSTHAGFENKDTATLVSLMVYTLVGIYTYIKGVFNDNPSLRFCGGALVLFVTARLLFVDVWQMEMTGRIIIFFVIGAMFISTAFLNKNKKRKSNQNNHEI